MNRLGSRPAGFTLIELLIAVVLMVMLVGVVVMVFTHSAEVMSTSEAKMEVYQNARSVFEFMARDMAGIQVGGFHGMGIQFVQMYPKANLYTTISSTEYFLGFFTIASWRDGGVGSGLAQIEYRLRKVGEVNGDDLVVIERALTTYTAAGVANPARCSLLGQYVHKPGANLRFHIEYYDRTTSRFVEPTSSHFFQTPTEVPPAVRVSMDLRDRRGKVIRTFSRVIWIATGGN